MKILAKILAKLLAVAAGVALVAAVALFLWARAELERPYRGYSQAEQLFEVRPGAPATAILTDLQASGIISNAKLARLFLVERMGDPPLHAGEYRFDRPLTIPQVLDRLVRGDVVLHPVTVVEGLTLEETARHLADLGLGREELFLERMRDPSPIADLDPEANTLEGYLLPDTYSFARGTSEAEIVATLVRTFRRQFTAQVEPLMTGDEERALRDLVSLAAIVEKEAMLDEERPVIAGVYANRLVRGIGLYADPTVIYALKQAGTWDGNLRRDDLRFDSPYNTYVYPGLPPGPICSPGIASLIAAARPTETSYLYFVSRNDGSHVFAETLREHNRNVERWQRAYWRERWARERREAAESEG